MSIEDGLASSAGPLFDAAASEEAKEEGIDQATSPLVRQARLAEAREVAKYMSLAVGNISSDDIALYYANRGIDLWQHLGNAAGAIFRGKEWEPVGFRKSVRVRSHSNLIRVWRLRA